MKGIGCVISGFVNAGEYHKGEPLFVGPMKDGTYVKSVVRSIHVAQTDVDYTYAGHSACFAISSLTKSQRSALSKKGMVALKEVPDSPAIRTFKADLVMLRGEPVTVTKDQFVATAHILHLKQAVRVTDFTHSNPARVGKNGHVSTDNAMVMRPGDQARVTFQIVGGAVVSSSQVQSVFIRTILTILLLVLFVPQYIRKGMRLLLRDGHVRAVGVIVETT